MIISKTLLFQQHRYQDGIALLGIVTQLASRMGYHRDPSHFPLCHWVREVRQRTWNHLCCMDSVALGCYGAESSLPAHTDTVPPKNVDDRDWQASRYATPKSVPLAVNGFTEMTFVLVNRELADLTRQLSHVSANDLVTKENLIVKTESSLHEKYFKHVDRSDPCQTIVTAFSEDKIMNLRLILRHRRAAKSPLGIEKSV